jgi:hypothetical protein
VVLVTAFVGRSDACGALKQSKSKKNKEKEVKDNRSKKFSSGTAVQNIVRALLVAFVALAVSGVGSAQNKEDKKDEVTFKLVPIQQFVHCLRANPFEEPKARATVIRGKHNDTLILDLDGVRPDLTLSVFTNERSFLGPDGTKDPNFHGFGLSWYQSDVQTGTRSDDGHVRIQTVLLDESFGFDPDVNLPPTNTFHVGLWFDDPQDAQGCSTTIIKPGPFNGEHHAGPLAFMTVPDETTKLGPLCTEPNITTTPASCGQQSPALVP